MIALSKIGNSLHLFSLTCGNFYHSLTIQTCRDGNFAKDWFYNEDRYSNIEHLRKTATDFAS
jgi:hypothetical protein